jgi:glycosyltransferase involved in cell wall biosynthesis
MDDVPAGPASPGPRRPSLSVVVPVYNGGSNFERCLRRLRDSSWTDFELVVVDDGSTDGSAEVAQRMGAIVARHDHPRGPAAARNFGAQLASAPLVFFLDADVAVYPQTLGRAMARFLADRGLTALIGSYDDSPSARGLVSQFRNLLHHFVHQQGHFWEDARPAHTFWTGCGMIRRDVFLDFGGFDPSLYPRPAIEDIELGYRLTRAGYSILLARDVLATHLKRWTLAEMVRTDIWRRGVPWMLLIKRSGTTETDLNVRPSQRLSVVITGLILASLASSPRNAWGAMVAALGSAAIVWLNRDFYGFLDRRKGRLFALAALPVHLVYFSCCGLSVVLALLQWYVFGPFSKPVTTAWQASSHEHVVHSAESIPRPFLVGLARRVVRWKTRSR